MRIKIIGSNSSGNCYLIETKKETLILEAGIKFDEIKKALNFNFSNVIGCVFSHEHGDHAKSIKKIENAGIDVYATEKTLRILKITNGFILKYHHSYKIGEFVIKPFPTRHDAVQPACFIISHKEFGNLLFVTDTNFIPIFSTNIDIYLIECNHDKDIMMKYFLNNKIESFLYNRIIRNHIDLQTLKTYFITHKIKKTAEIILIHLSKKNANKMKCQKEIKKITGVPIYIANKNEIINF